MDILTILFIFMITTSITLTGFVLRQKKNNKMLGELVAQNKVNQASRYSAIGIGMQNQEYVSKCPACAEWIKLEAKVCRACQKNVEDHNSNLKDSMTKIDLDLQTAVDAKKKADKELRQQLFRNPFFRVLVGLLIVVGLIFISLNVAAMIRFNRGTAAPESASALVQKWNQTISECSIPLYEVVGKPDPSDGLIGVSFSLGNTLSDFDWNSDRGKRLICFSNNALGFDLTKKLSMNGVNNIDLPNGFALFGSADRNYVTFYWERD
jgi:hypothetical protein